MILYVRQTKNIEFLHKLFNVLKIERNDDKTIVNLPINKNSRNKKIQKVFEKLGKYLYNNNIRNIVLEKELMQSEEAKIILYNNNINILDGSTLSKFLIYNAIKKIYEYKNLKIEAGEITILVNENDDINLQTIKMIAQSIKRLNIITNNIKRFRKIADYLYTELGILIKLSNNMKTNLKSTDIIVNIDFPEETINKLEIPNNAIILNIPRNINVKTKKFSGVNIKSMEIGIPDDYKMDSFDAAIMYEASLYKMPVTKIFDQIEKDNVQISSFIGVNGSINPLEFKKLN